MWCVTLICRLWYDWDTPNSWQIPLADKLDRAVLECCCSDGADVRKASEREGKRDTFPDDLTSDKWYRARGAWWSGWGGWPRRGAPSPGDSLPPKPAGPCKWVPWSWFYREKRIKINTSDKLWGGVTHKTMCLMFSHHEEWNMFTGVYHILHAQVLKIKTFTQYT